jgi:hypothetical protein
MFTKKKNRNIKKLEVIDIEQNSLSTTVEFFLIAVFFLVNFYLKTPDSKQTTKNTALFYKY